MQPNANAFPTKDVEFSLVGTTSDRLYKRFDITTPGDMDNTEIQKYVNPELLDPRREIFEDLEDITDEYASSPPPMQTIRYRVKKEAMGVVGYLAIYFMKLGLCRGILFAIDRWNQKIPESEYKIGVEVKAMFTKSHLSQLDSAPDIQSSKRVMFIHRILDMPIQGRPDQDQLKQLGSLVSAVEQQCFENNHTRDSAHIFDWIIELRIHIYRVEQFCTGGSWFLLPKRIANTHACLNPRNLDDRCFYYACLLGMMDLEKVDSNRVQPSTIEKYARIQGIKMNCTLKMPVEPTKKNFQQFEEENPGWKLIVYMPAPEINQVAITPIYVSPIL